MPERKAHFRFLMDRKVIVTNKRILALMARRHVHDSVGYVNRAAMRLRELASLVRHLESMEARLLKSELLAEDEDEREDMRLVVEAMEAIQHASQAIEELRSRKIEAAIAFEDAVKKALQEDKRQQKIKKEEMPPPPEEPAAPVAPTPTPVPAAAPAPAPLVLRFPPELLEAARREALAQEKERESQENEY